MSHSIVQYRDTFWSVLRVVDDFGLQALDLIGIPRRCVVNDGSAPLYSPGVDMRRASAVLTPALQLKAASASEPWLKASGKGLARLHAAFLIGEDPQRRLDTSKTAVLMHQLSLVQHVAASSHLRRVMIADEVGLGKTIEAGLIIKRVHDQYPRARVLYLAPARLVGNVVSEFREKLDLDARRWVASSVSDARLDSDRIVVASIHKSVFGDNSKKLLDAGPWDVLVVDECHHLSDWGAGGGKPNRSFRLVKDLAEKLPENGRLVLLSGTPHQGSVERFGNLLRLLSDDGKDIANAAGRVIYRTKDRIKDWKGRPLFPRREVRAPVVVTLGPAYRDWYRAIGDIYDGRAGSKAAVRATGWAKGQALQWASSSVEAGLGFLVRLAIRRLGWTPANEALASALSCLIPYRGGPVDESPLSLYLRLVRQIGVTAEEQDSFDAEGEAEGDDDEWRPNATDLEEVLTQGVKLANSSASMAKCRALRTMLDEAEGEKVVLFAQPVETVTLVARFLEKAFKVRPALIIGNQTDDERMAEIERFKRPDGPQFLVSSRAGGEGLNMQVARRLIHLDVPWNPMELEQRIGRVHRFGSRKTILVDTLVVADTREVDMYRIAREKLRLIASQLDSEQFESLFGRVMAIVPPKDLESLLGNDPAGPITDGTARQIGDLVRQGYSVWEEFDRRYRGQADHIRAIDGGAATWLDLQAFVVGGTNAKPANDVRFFSLEFDGDEIVDRAENVPGLWVENQLHVCADTAGMPAEDAEGRRAIPLGINHELVRDALFEALVGSVAGAAYVKRPKELTEAPPGKFGLLAFLRQTVRFSADEIVETGLTLHAWLVPHGGIPVQLEQEQRAAIVRALLKSSRLKDPAADGLVDQMIMVEAEMINVLRRPTDEERADGIRAAVWPMAAIVVQ